MPPSSLSANQFTQPEVGDSLDIFSLRSELHQGAMATLFLAEDQLSRQQVVLKIPCGDILNHPILLYHYQNEERISRLLNHPGIIGFIHRQRSRQYIIMEYVAGKDLRCMVGKNRPLELNKALALMMKLCDVVAYLHDKGVVHLDLKPENILCYKDSSIKVIDFGLASCSHLPDLFARDIKNPQGTPWYIAPEQLLGERSDLRCDIYSMGMLFYEMLTGQLPWPRSKKVQIARRRLRHDPAPPRFYNIDIPPQLQSIILRAIARHPGDRYSSAKDLFDDLKNWQQQPITVMGSNCKNIPLWRRVFPGKAIQKTPQSQRRTQAKTSETPPQIIGALIDCSGSDHMLLELKKQTLIRSAEVTLVHVIEEESDSHVRRYGITVEGEQLMARLERAVQLFRRCSIDPTIRLIRGEVVDVLRTLCTETGAELLVIGPSRKKEGLLRSASVRRRLEKNSPCPLTVATEEQFSPATHLASLHPEELTAQQILASDIFLVDLWYEHLHYHTDRIYQRLLQHPNKKADKDGLCLFSSFLTTLQSAPHWQEVVSILEPIHKQFVQLISKIADLPEDDFDGLQGLYSNETLALSCKLKKELSRVSSFFHEYQTKELVSVPFLVDLSCPVSQPELACYGPLLHALTLDQDLCVLIRNKEKNAANPHLAEYH